MGKIAGKITKSDGATPLAGAVVKAYIGGITKSLTTTNAAGDYLMTLSTGIYDVEASKTGYETQTKLAQSVVINSTILIDFVLFAKAEEKPQKEYTTIIGDNLFNPRNGGIAKIKFNVPTRGNVSLKIYDFSGDLIKTLFNGEISAGYYQKDWDGKDEHDRYVVPGVYLLHYVYSGGKEVRKIGVMK
ncbi:MAG: carboxypeptidase regulatory-like domain-containing protein [Elusimicrobia bacterium]|nr:carboxypeptidase regulatory-like domain-containing protein [Elusimicrobiota bacterium]